jgi:hypothetical protein
MGQFAVIAGPKPLPPTTALVPRGAPTGDVNEAAVTAALERLRSDGSYQFDFTEAPTPPEPPAWLADIAEFFASLFSGLGPVFTALFWILVAALLLFVLYMLVPAVRDWVDNFVFRRKKTDEAEAIDDWRPTAEAARNLLAEADTLAAQGRYGDAVRLLLGRSLEDIDRRRPAMTSRVIAVEPALPPPARSAFADLAATVERALFALRDISADDWRASRAAYERFALRDQWAGAPV